VVSEGGFVMTAQKSNTPKLWGRRARWMTMVALLALGIFVPVIFLLRFLVCAEMVLAALSIFLLRATLIRH
jgi:hypothetical protein